MNRWLAFDYARDQRRERPSEQRDDPIMVGDLPLKQHSHFLRVLNAENPPTGYVNSNPNYEKAAKLNNLQVLLHLEGQETEAVILGGCEYRWDHWNGCIRAPFHEEIRANWEQFARVQANNQLEDFTISNMTLPPAPFFRNQIVPILQNETLVRLDLIHCDLRSSELHGVAEILKKCPTLISLCLARNENMNVDGAKALSSAMAKHKGLFFVDLSRCGLGGNDEILPVILKGCKKLNGLDLSWNFMRSKGLALIAKFLSTHKTITIFNLGGSGIYDESATSLNKAVEKNKTLTELSLASTKITLSTSIQRSLVLNDKLLHIDLSGNKLRSNGAKYITKHLKKNPPLSILSLRGCGFPSKSAEGLGNALKRNTNLAHLDLNCNNFNDRSVPFFADALRNNSTLLSFHMSGNNIMAKRAGGRISSNLLFAILLAFRALLNPTIHVS